MSRPGYTSSLGRNWKNLNSSEEKTSREKALGMLGLATRAGKSCSGEFSAENALKKGKAALVILSEDASDNTVKHFSDMSAHRQVPCIRLGTKEQLGKFCGKAYRSVAVVTDPGFAEQIRKRMSP
jgi:ribosomal protein L7Ae-like RNA K-turn-binding protein